MSDLIKREDVISKFAGLDMQVYEGDRCVGIRTSLTKEEIIHAIYDIPSAEQEERTAKVEDVQVEWGDDEYVNDRMGDMYHYGNCGNCGKTVSHNQKYCHECGARLEWK